MSKKKIILIVIAVIVIAGGLYAWREYNRGMKDLDDVKAELSADAVALIGEFLENEPAANTKYQDKVTEVKGMVKKVIDVDNTFTIVLGDTTDMSSVRCLVDSTHTDGVAGLQRGTIVVVKGSVTGFKKDETGLLGSDVELNRCVIKQ